MLRHMVGYALANRKGVGTGHKTGIFLEYCHFREVM